MKKSKLNSYNAKRRKKRWRQYYGSTDYLAHIHSQMCIVPGCQNSPEACHTKSKNSGGTWRDLYPACRYHHTGGMGEHNIGKETFMKTFGVDIYAEAARMVQMYLDAHPNAPLY